MNKACKDCIHYNLCQRLDACFEYYNAPSPIHLPETCSDFFKDKSRYIELPCAVGDTVYFIQSKRIYSGQIVLIRPFIHKDNTTFHGNVEYECEDPFYNDGRKMRHQVSVVFQEYGNNTIAYLTKEEAEQALKGGVE